MKRDLRTIINITLLAALTLPQLARAQTYDIPAGVVGSGGGTSSSTNYSLSGTVGQPAADIGLSGAAYSHDAGFWPAAQALTGGAPAVVPTAEADSLALVALYNSTGGSGWYNVWDLENTAVATWYGVTVAGGRVTGLDLFNNNLSGPIPTGTNGIGKLTGLTYLRLADNPLTGSIPAEIGYLTNLTVLQLISNQLTGDIPPAIGDLTSLTELSLYNNQLTGPIPDAIQYLTALTRLDLDDNQLTGPIPTWIGSLTNLERLFLGGNSFSGYIPDEVGDLTSLQALGVNSFQLPPNDPGWNVNLASLTRLHLWGRRESDAIPAWVGTLTQLTGFYLWDHQLSGGIPDWVGNFTSLTRLWIARSELGAPIPTWIGDLTGLEYLYIYDNQLAGAVPAAVADLTQLQYLYLPNNQLDDLPDLNPLKTSLLRLRVQGNRFTFEDIVPNVGVASEEYTYAPQDSVGLERDTTVAVGADLILRIPVGGGTGNQYQWMKDGTNITGETEDSLQIGSASAADVGSYILRTTNGGAPDLTLYSRPINVTVVAPPTAITRPPTNITSTAAVLKGLVNPNGFSTAVSFDWGPTMGYGQVSVAEQSPVTGIADVAVSVPITNLTAGATYHYRVVAQRTAGTITGDAGDDQVFTTPSNENTTIDIAAVTGDGEVSFPGTDVTLGITFDQPGEGTIEVFRIETAPGGTPVPSDLTLIAERYWEIDYNGGGTFSNVEMTFILGAGVITSEDRANLENLKLLRRADEASVNWDRVGTTLRATDSSVTFTDLASFSQFTVTRLVLDTEPPSFTNLIAQQGGQWPLDVGGIIGVTATVEDLGSGLQYVNLHYSRGEPSFIENNMSGSGTDWYGEIPSNDVTVSGVVYFVEAVDMTDNIAYSDTNYAPVRFSENTLDTNIPGSAYSGAFPSEVWRLISVPANLDDSNMKNALDELGEQDDYSWKTYSYYDGQLGENPPDIWPGAGYWIQQRVDYDVYISVGSGNTHDGDFIFDLRPGWNLIGTPFPFKLSINLDQGEGGFYGPISYGLYGYEEWSGVEPELMPWAGYAVWNRGGDQFVTVRPLPVSGAYGKKIDTAHDVMYPQLQLQDQAGWLLQLRAEGKTYADGANAIGRLEGATEQLDYFDNPEPPYIDGFVSLAMERDDWGANLPRFTSDIRSIEENDGVWDLELFVKGEKDPITLSHELQGDLPPDNRIILLDVRTREVHDLLENNRPLILTGYREEFPYHLKIVAGSASYVEYTTKEILASLPSDFSLAQNYPNPFNPATTLRYSLFQPARVSLKIYNLLGQEVVTLVDGWQDLGHYEVIWEGHDRFGAEAASGIYFAVYMAEGRLFTRKMVLMK